MVNTDTHALLGHHDHQPAAPTQAERRTRWVVVLTLVMMVLEIVVGHATGSMALLADGWHMATHAGALGLSALAYWFARTRSGNAEYTFGTGKVSALAGYTSAASLGLVAVAMVVESIERLLNPGAIHFSEAIPVSVLGLVVNGVSAWLLGGGGHSHDHAGHDHAGHAHGAHDHDSHGHDSHHHGAHDLDSYDHHSHHHDSQARNGANESTPTSARDHNLRAAYVHVLADALTSVLAIVALVCGAYLGWHWLDSLTGLLGAGLIAKWAVTLLRTTARELLDACPSPETQARIKRTLEGIDDVQVRDLHLWSMGEAKLGCIVTLMTQSPREACEYRALLKQENLAHLTIEVHQSSEREALAPRSSPT